MSVKHRQMNGQNYDGNSGITDSLGSDFDMYVSMFPHAVKNKEQPHQLQWHL